MLPGDRQDVNHAGADVRIPPVPIECGRVAEQEGGRQTRFMDRKRFSKGTGSPAADHTQPAEERRPPALLEGRVTVAADFSTRRVAVIRWSRQLER